MGHSIMLNWDMVSLTSSEYRRRNLETLATHWESKGGKLADLAELIGMSPSYFSQLRSGARGVGDKTARKIEAKLEWPRGALDHVIGPPGSAGQALPIKHWPTLEEQEHALKNVVLFPDADILGTESDTGPTLPISPPETDPGYVRVEQIGEADMGDGRVNDDFPDVIRSVDFTEPYIRSLVGFMPAPGRLKLVTGRGDSMVPTIMPGDVVLVDTGCNCFDGDGLYLVNSGNGQQIKRLHDRGGVIHVVSDNAVYAPVPVNERTVIGGKVYLRNRLDRMA